MATATKVTTQLVPPSLAVRIAWGLTGEWSENEKLGDEAVRERERIKDLQERAKASPQEQRYVDGVIRYIWSSLRTLSTIHSGRDINFKEVGQLRENLRENIESFSKLTTSWQSAWPRLLTVGFGGATGTITLVDLVHNLFPAVDKGLLQAYLFVIGASLLYLGNELFILPRVRGHLTDQRIKADLDRNRYYDQYVERSRNALIGLYNDVNRWHRDVFGSLCDSELEAASAVDQTLAGAFSTMCPKVNSHMEQGIIRPDRWSMCEAGARKEECPYWNRP